MECSFRQAEKKSRSSGAGVNDVFNSSWEHFEHMAFLETIPEADSAMSTLDKSDDTTPPAPKKSKSSQESEARAALYTALAKSFEKPTSPPPSSSELKKDGNNLMECANLFGKTVADNLLQCDPKDWTLINKKKFFICFLIMCKGIRPQEIILLHLLIALITLNPMLPRTKTVDTLVIKHLHNRKTISQVQDFKITAGLITRCNLYIETIRKCNLPKHPIKILMPPFQLLIAILLDKLYKDKGLCLDYF